MTVGLNACNPGEFFAGVGLMHVLDAPARWRRDCRALILETPDAEPDRNPRLSDPPAFSGAEDRLGWKRTMLPQRLQWSALDCTLMWWADVDATGITPSQLKTYAGNRAAADHLKTLVAMVQDNEDPPRTWNDALRTTAWHTSSPFKTDTRVLAASAGQLGFSTDRVSKSGEEKVEIQIYPWVDLLACAGLHMSAARLEYRIWHRTIPPTCTAAAVRHNEDSTTVRFHVRPTTPPTGGPVYKQFSLN